MYYHKLYGPVVPEKGWVPAPRFILRRERVLKNFHKLKPGKVLEIGCGPGTISNELGEMGFDCLAVESSQKAFDIAKYVNEKSRNVEISKKLPAKKSEYDVLMAFEVLEHIEKDRDILQDWSKYILPDGLLVLSVPAHMSKWGDTDVWAGHYRRYEKKELISLLENTGFEIVKFESYGFPLSNLIEPLRNYHHSKKLKEFNAKSEHDMKVRTGESGVSRSAESSIFPLFARWPVTWIMAFFMKFQNLFLDMDLGTGYLVLARKK